MPILWQFKIDVRNLDTRELYISGTRTDDATVPPTEWTDSVYGKFDLANKTRAELLTEYADIFSALWATQKEKEAKIAALVAQAEAALANEMMNRENI